MSSTTETDPAARLKQVNEEVARIQRHQNAGRFGEAEKAINALLSQYPEHPQLLHLKGLNLVQQGETEAGLSLLATVVEHDPDNVPALVDYGVFLAQNGQADKAMIHLRQAAEIAPNNALAQANLGALLVSKQAYDEAITALNAAARLNSEMVDVHLNLAQAYIRSFRFQPAVDPLFRALALDPQSVAAHVGLAHALFRAERHEAAEHHARRALEIDPDAHEAKLHLGNILAAMGRMDDAAKAFLEVAAQPGRALGALTRLIALRKTTADSPEYRLLTQYADRTETLPERQRVQLHFALGKAADDLGDAETAIGHFHKGNAITAQMYPFDAETSAKREQRMRSLVTPAFVQRHRGAGLHEVAPIFICGMPRSGTTLMEQMFSRHPKVQAGGELRATAYAFHNSPDLRQVLEEEAPDSIVTDDMLTRLGEQYQTFLHREGLRSEYVTDKMPNNYLYAGLLALAFPRAKILIMRRHPLDNLLSNYMQNFGNNQPFSTSFETMAQVYDQFDKTARHQLETLPDQVRFVEYEKVVADPEAQMREALDFVGLPYDAGVLDYTKSLRAVNTASVSQVREPIYATSVAKWQRYGPLLKDLAERLGGHLSPEDRKACGLDG